MSNTITVFEKILEELIGKIEGKTDRQVIMMMMMRKKMMMMLPNIRILQSSHKEGVHERNIVTEIF